MKRLFIAIPAGIAVQKSLNGVNQFFLGYRKFLKIVKPENYHLTVKFLGNTDDSLSENIADGFGRLKFNIPEIRSEITGLGAFPVVERANVLWSGVKMDYANLDIILKVIDNFFFDHGFERSGRKFHPHITLARVRTKAKIPGELISYLKNNSDTLYSETAFERIVLYESTLLRDGPDYTEYASAALN